MTSSEKIYERFFDKITDDMYILITEEETNDQLYGILESAIVYFRFPKFNSEDFDENGFSADLTREEIQIIATLMVIEWLKLQSNNIDLLKLKYTGAEFKIYSQANHIDKISTWLAKYEKENIDLQHLYSKRRITSTGAVSNYHRIVGREEWLCVSNYK